MIPLMIPQRVIDGIHLCVCVFFVVGGFVSPVRLLPLLIVFIIYMLARYPDYCFLSEVSKIFRELSEDRDSTYSDDLRSIYSSFGLELSPKAMNNLNLALVGTSGCVAVYRLCRANGIRLICRETVSRYLVAAMIFLAAGCELIIHLRRSGDAPPKRAWCERARVFNEFTRQ